MTAVTIYYLEMHSPDSHKAKSITPDLQITEACVKQYQVNKMLYELVGEDWCWNEKSDWTVSDWQQYCETDNLRTWMAYSQGSIAGYFELQKKHDAPRIDEEVNEGIDDEVNEIAYFGLTPKFIGRGFGGVMLSEAITQAWRWGNPDRVIVNTCTLDHPSALSNYRSRGFEVVREKQI